MPAADPAFLAKRLRAALRAADKACGEYESYMYTSMTDHQAYHEELLEAAIKSLHVMTAAALEALGMPRLLEKFEQGFASFKDDLTQIAFAGFTSEMYSPPIEFAREYVQAIEAVAGLDITVDRATHDRSRLEGLLAGTAKFINDRNIDPRNEAEVRYHMYSVLTLVFPDTIREFPVPKVIKSYKPDFGVPSLRAAIEYKFCDSEKEAKKAVAGIFEDIAGYEGTQDWEWFYAVIYMTKPFVTQDQVEADFASAKTAKKWKPIVQVGRGARSGKTAG